MTIIRQGGGNALTGMIGAIVIAQRNGKPYYRSAPQRKVKDSWTPQQLLHRQRFSMVNKFCKLFVHSLIPQIWNYEAEKMSGYALFLKANMPAFAPDGALEDAKKIQLSTGKLPFPPRLQAVRSGVIPNSIDVNWTREMQCNGYRMSDELMVISADDGKYSEITVTGLTRKSFKGSFELPVSPMPTASSPLHIYLLFASKDRRDYSVSACYEV